MTDSRAVLDSYIKSAHSIITLLLDHLDNHLDLPSNTLRALHRLYSISGDQVRFLKAPPQPIDDRQVALGAHTDFGTLTVLFNRVGGLQVLPPSPPDKEPQWMYVKPLQGHAIVNLGDALSKFTNGLLRSNMHRVVSPPGLQAEEIRYSLVYFSRPEDDVPLRRLEGGNVIPPLKDGEEEEAISSKAWVLRRALGRRVGGNVKEGWEGTEKSRI